MGSLCRCLAGIPCGALCVFVAFCAAVVACGSSLIIAMRRTRAVVDQQDLLPWFMYACIGAAIGLLLVAVLFLIATTASAKVTASRPFVSTRRLRCLRATSCMMMVLTVLLQFVWMIVTIVISVAVLYLLLIDRMIDSGARCINLMHYAVPRKNGQLICRSENSNPLMDFHDDVTQNDLLIYYSISLVSSLVIVVTLGLFVLISTSDFARLGQQNKSPGRSSGRDVRSDHMISAYYDGQSVPHETAM